MKTILLFNLIAITICACSPAKEKKPSELISSDISKVITQMTDIMIHDVTNPPLASRFFSYACLAGYEVVSQNDSSFQNMHGILNEYAEIQRPQNTGNYSWQLSAILAMMKTAAKLQPSGSLFAQYEKNFLDSCRKIGYSDAIIEGSQEYALAVSKNILAYAKSDKYNLISNYPRYNPLKKEGFWYPTPPGFFAPVEPYFNTVRSFTLDTCTQFKPLAPAAFSKDKNSAFYKMMQETYYAGGSGLTDSHRDIAAFWDCNPFALKDNGHMLVGLKKISPGAHWLGITGIACSKAKLNFSKSMKINTLVAIGLMDGFICCWDEKFRSNRIRPETAIRKYLDPGWTPLLQTPPFPEYLSGHSTISATSAKILTYYFGDNFNYTDNVEVKYGLPERSFKSFNEAAREAAMSRLWGGIHFRDAIDHGITQGSKVGDWVIGKFEKTNNRRVAMQKKYNSKPALIY